MKRWSLIAISTAWIFSLQAAETVLTLPIITPNANADTATKPLTISGFHVVGSAQLPDKDRVETTAILYSDRQFICISIECSEPQIGSIKADHTTTDSAVYEDDDVEIFLSPTAGSGGKYIQIAVNPAGAVFDAYISGYGKNRKVDIGWSSESVVRSQINKDSWTAEIKIPIHSIPIESISGPWSIHLCRQRTTVPTFYASEKLINFHDINRSARLNGIDRLEIPFAPSGFTFGGFFPGENKAEFNLKNARSSPTSASIEIDGKTIAQFDSAAIAIQSDHIELPYQLASKDSGKTIAVNLYSNNRLIQRRTTKLDSLAKDPLGEVDRSLILIEKSMPIRLEIPVFFSSGKNPLALAWSIVDVNGMERASEVTKVADGLSVLSTKTHEWQPGIYRLSTRLLAENKEISTRDYTLRLIAGPFSINKNDTP